MTMKSPLTADNNEEQVALLEHDESRRSSCCSSHGPNESASNQVVIDMGNLISHTRPESLPLPASTLVPDEPKQCRICGMEEGDGYDDDADDVEDNDMEEESTRPRSKDNDLLHAKNPLIRPCLCKGSMMYVHVKCLNRWRESSPRPESYVACDVCGYQYHIWRPRYAAIISNPWFLCSLTLFSVLSLVILFAYLCKIVDIHVLHRPLEDEWHGPTFAWLDGVYLLAGVVVVSLFGFAYLIYTCTVSRDTSSNMPHLCDQPGCPWYSCYFADLTACSGDAAIGGMLVFAVFLGILFVTFGIIFAVSGAYTLTKNLVEHVAGRVKERILDVGQ